MKEKYTKATKSKAQRYTSKLKRLKITNRKFKAKNSNPNFYALNRSTGYRDSFLRLQNENEKEVKLESVPLPRLLTRTEDAMLFQRWNDQKQNIDEKIPTWEKLTFKDKAKLFSHWVIAIIFTNIIIIIG